MRNFGNNVQMHGPAVKWFVSYERTMLSGLSTKMNPRSIPCWKRGRASSSVSNTHSSDLNELASSNRKYIDISTFQLEINCTNR